MKYFRPHRGNLFRRSDSFSFEEELKELIRKEIGSLSEDYVLNVSEAEYLSYLVTKYSPSCPRLLINEKNLEKEQVLVDPEYLSQHWHVTNPVERIEYRINIPFEGNSKLLGVRPSKYTLSDWPNISFSDSEIFFFVLDLNNNASLVKGDIDSYISTLEVMMGYLANDFVSICNRLPSFISQCFTQKKEQIIKDVNLVADLGIPMKDASKKPNTYSIPTIIDAVKPIATHNPKKPNQLEPCMAIEEYNNIISSIQRIGKNMERFPEMVTGKNEETLRAEFLAQLSSSYRSYSAVGEAFNKKGKTDIMVTSGDNIVFVAECKLWKGASVLSKAIDQLLSYLTWRESKTALLIFNKGANISHVLASIVDIVKAHPCFIDFDGVTEDSVFHFRLHFPTDIERSLLLTILVFDFKEKDYGRM